MSIIWIEKSKQAARVQQNLIHVLVLLTDRRDRLVPSLIFAFHSILLLIISVISVISLIAGRFSHGHVSEMQPATTVQRFVVAFAYISLAGMLAYLYWLSHNTVSALVRH